MKFEKVSEKEYTDVVSKYFDNFIYYQDLKLPERATANSAGYDFYLPISIRNFMPDEEILIPTGIKWKAEGKHFLAIVPRSSLGMKYNIQLSNTIGIIDGDYYNNEKNEGHIFIKLKNCGDKIVNLNLNDRFAQGIIIPYATVEDDNTTGKRKGGMGSTDA